ncbi:MAG: DUF262 domain-containing protein [Hyphomonas sp.]|jgi:hypothetical protein
MSEITSAVHSVESYFQLGQLMPANIQRDYQWTPEQVRVLIQDLIGFVESIETGAPDDVYFLGTLIGVREDTMLRLYDGLQRTATLSLLIAYLRDRIDDSRLSDRLHACIGFGETDFRLRLPPPDQTYSESIAPRGATRAGILGGFHGRRIALRRNLNAIGNCLGRRQPDWLARFALKVLEQTRFVLISLSHPQIAEKVFETVNMRGLAVQPHDLIKSRLAQLAMDSEEAEYTVSSWDSVRQNVAQEYDAFTQSLTDRLLEYPDLQRRDHMHHLFDWLADSAAATPRRTFQLVDEGRALTFAWNRVISCTDGWTKAKEMAPLLPVWVIPWRDWIPVAMELTRRRLDKEVPEKWLPSDLDALQRFCMIVLLSELSDSGRRSLFRTLHCALRSGSSPFQQVIAGSGIDMVARVHRTLRKPLDDFRLRRSLMLWIESQDQGLNLRHLKSGRDDRSDVFDPAQIEHILPQNPSIQSDWHTLVPDSASQASVINLIGNLVVVPKSVNEELGRKDFNEKRRILQKSQSRLQRFTTVQDVLSARSWSPADIRARTERMTTKLCEQLQIAPLPAEHLAPDSDGYTRSGIST